MHIHSCYPVCHVRAGYRDVENVVAGVQWRLLTMVTRRESRKEWQKMATRVGWVTIVTGVMILNYRGNDVILFFESSFSYLY